MKDHPPKDEAPLLNLLNVKPEFRPDEESPPVDEELIERYAAGELAGREVVEVEFAIRSFAPWYWAWSRAVARRSRIR